MPQLDKATFFTQIFWVFALFIVFYFMVARHYMPSIVRTMKARQKHLKKMLITEYKLRKRSHRMNKNTLTPKLIALGRRYAEHTGRRAVEAQFGRCRQHPLNTALLLGLVFDQNLRARK